MTVAPQVTTTDVDRISHPLRLAKGSHQPGSGKGCVMNIISCINGDARNTDFPACSARPLAILVHACNDLLAGPDGYLSPENSLVALDVAWQTMGTADVTDTVIHAWVAELLTNPTWGAVQYTKLTAIKAIYDIGALHRKAASGDMPPWAAWNAADRVARTVASAINPDANRAGSYAIRSAHQSTALIDAHPQATLDAVTASALCAHALASGGTAVTRVLELTRYAIRAWRHLAGPGHSAPHRLGIGRQRPTTHICVGLEAPKPYRSDRPRAADVRPVERVPPALLRTCMVTNDTRQQPNYGESRELISATSTMTGQRSGPTTLGPIARRCCTPGR